MWKLWPNYKTLISTAKTAFSGNAFEKHFAECKIRENPHLPNSHLYTGKVK
jgi:hypothetical protein